MQVHHGIDGLKSLPPGCVLSVGNFDGVHRGHRRLLEIANDLRGGSGAGGVALVTFEPHPLTVLRPQLAPPRLTPLPLKQSLLEPLGVDHLIILPPTPDVLNLTAEVFWQILRDDVRPTHMIEGESFNFGKGRGGSINRLREWSANTDVQLHVIGAVRVPLLDLQVVAVNSSLIRWLLMHGRARDAAICLGRPYIIEGTVIQGHQRGRTIGVPTANLDCGDQLVPAEGVYVGRCQIDGTTHAAAASIGTMPTFGENQLQVEVHVIDFSGDLYGQTLRVELVDWVREQWRFADIEALKQRMAGDIKWSRRRFHAPVSEPFASLS
ncbi:MAG TPA: riboflavin biosynthesis protein RibF [Tepidisphaeraceae bacterium]|nr:riboflavin biosynthesis protein RibF [Tepidisphaeraceae bacterium]